MQIVLGDITLNQVEIITIVSSLLIVGILWYFSRKLAQNSRQNIELAVKEQMAEVENSLKVESNFLRDEILKNSRNLKQDVAHDIKNFGDNLTGVVDRSSAQQKDNLHSFSNNINYLREEVDKKLENIKRSNREELDKMRFIVDEKLQSTLEKRLGESYRQVSERLTEVHQGLGEMKKLAVGVDDLKKTLSNVKMRGTWGEIQLGNILEQVLNPSQYDKNANTNPESKDHVEYAVKIPNKAEDNSFIYLPIDAKFPMDAYVKVIEAAETKDEPTLQTAIKNLQKAINVQAKKITEKYINPPHTTDFAVMFMPTEALYAEIAKIPGLIEEVQNNYKVTVAGPSNLFALLNSLQMGFRTLAIEKHSSEVWDLLGEIKREFDEYGVTINKVKKKLLEASNSIETVERRGRVMDKKLNKVGEIEIKSKQLNLNSKPVKEDS